MTVKAGNTYMTTASARGYSPLSIAAHWLAAICIIILYFTPEGGRDSALRAFHIGFGALVAIPLIWRAVRRMAIGFPEKPAQHPLFNLASQIVIWGFLVAIVVASITGPFVVWSLGHGIDMLGLFSIPSPFPKTLWLHELTEGVHSLAGNAIMPLLVLHIAGALKHAMIDRDGVVSRMVTHATGGM
jgi:cytochrome b561